MKTFKEPSDETTPKQLKLSLGYLKGVPLFSGLSDQDIAPFDNSSQIRSYKKGKILYVQGDAPNFFYIIGGGWVKLFRTMPEGDEVIVDMLTSGHMFGESAIFEKGYHMCTAQVIEDIHLLSIPSEILRSQISVSPRLALNMLASMSRHHRHHVSALAFNTMLSAPQRIGCFLLRLCSSVTDKESAVLALPYDKSLIADTLGMKGSTFSRALNILRDNIDMQITGGNVEIRSVKQLAMYVYGPSGTKYISADL